MSKARSIIITVAASIAVGAVLGMLYAPVEGAKARKKLRKIKNKLSGNDDTEDDRETLEELSGVLQKEVTRINAKLDKL